ncbi:MAG: BrnA antitoxin family protein [Oscillospiraceae bacterium]|nr:BrnA antitoxin family protein [Oscillospiraceae bacterium]
MSESTATARRETGKREKRQVSINLDVDTISYFKSLAGSSGIPYQTLINLYLTDCATNDKHMTISWN